MHLMRKIALSVNSVSLRTRVMQCEAWTDLKSHQASSKALGPVGMRRKGVPGSDEGARGTHEMVCALSPLKEAQHCRACV